jgi:tetratricopeptide (TPR) repeat protein
MYLDIGEYDKALEYLYLAEKKNPNKYLSQIAVVLCYQGKIYEAEKILNKSIGISENNDKGIDYANLSLIYKNKSDYKKALYYATKAYEENPYNIEISIYLAQIYKLNNEFEEAINIYTNLLKYDRNNPQYYYSLGILYNDINDKNNALKFLNKAIEFDPKNEKYNKKIEELKKTLLLTL